MDSQENVADQYDVSAKLISHLVVLSLDICMGAFQNDPMNSSVVAKTCFGCCCFLPGQKDQIVIMSQHLCQI